MPLNPLKQSFAWWAFARKVATPEELVKEAVRIGYAAVEMTPSELFPMIRDNGLVIASIGGHGTLSDGMNNPASHNRIAAEIEDKLQTAAQFQIPNLIVFSGNRNGISEEEGRENCATVLRRVAPFAESAGVNLVMELLNSRVDHPDYQCDHTQWGVEMCRMVNSPRVKLLYDIYHMQIMEGDIIRTLRDNIAHIGHFHTAGNPGRKDLDDQQELYYPAIARAIAETGYDGYIGHEFSPKGEAIPALEQAFRECDVQPFR